MPYWIVWTCGTQNRNIRETLSTHDRPALSVLDVPKPPPDCISKRVYDLKFDSCIRWEDTDIRIKWFANNPVVSEKEQHLKHLDM
jgi:hypothetical protein